MGWPRLTESEKRQAEEKIRDEAEAETRLRHFRRLHNVYASYWAGSCWPVNKAIVELLIVAPEVEEEVVGILKRKQYEMISQSRELDQPGKCTCRYSNRSKKCRFVENIISWIRR